MTKPVTTILTIAVHSPNSNPVYGAGTLHVSLDDEAGGVYITIKELSDGSEQGVVRIDPDEVPIVFETAMKLLAQETLNKNDTDN
jgi:hypothetical protein